MSNVFSFFFPRQGYTPEENSARLALEPKTETTLRGYGYADRLSYRWFGKAEDLERCSEQCPRLEFVYLGNPHNRTWEEMCGDAAVIACAVQDHPNKPWIVFPRTPVFLALNQGTFGGFRVHTEFGTLAGAVLSRWNVPNAAHAK